ncbi:MAG: hypothetical protein K2X66_05075, partial [Cyanobacteria bacterium]|nr:hypothetical protein [Cyanobacteriota bacterium]
MPNQETQPFQGIVLPSQKAFNTKQGPLNLDQVYFGALGPPPVQQKPIHFLSVNSSPPTELDKAYLEALQKPKPKTVWEMLFDRKKNTKQDAVDRLNKLLYRLGSGHKMTIDSLHSNRMLIAVLDVSTEFLTPKELIHTAEFVIQSMAAKDKPALPTVLMEHGLSHSSHEIRSFAANYLMLALPFTPETMKAFRSRLGVEDHPEVITLLKRGISSHNFGITPSNQDFSGLQADLHMENPAFRSLGIEGLSQYFNPGFLRDLLSALDRETDPQLIDQIGKVLKEKAKEDIKLNEPMVAALESVALNPQQYQSPVLMAHSILNALMVSKKIEGFPRFFQLFKSSDLIQNDTKLGELLEKLMKRSFTVEYSPFLLPLLKGPNNTEKNQKLALTLLDGTAHEALTQPLFEYLESPESKFPKLALAALAHHGKKMERNHLEKLLSSVNPDLRLLAAKGFVHQAEDKDIEMLFHRLKVETQPEIQSELSQA